MIFCSTFAYSTQYSPVKHGCSTLGGDSASPVVDLETYQVIGPHVGERYSVRNSVVPPWMLRTIRPRRKRELNLQ